MKTLTLTRQELIWQTREISWSDTDYQAYIKWLLSFKHAENTSAWTRNNYRLGEWLSQYSWEQVVHSMTEYDPNEPVFEFFDDDGNVLHSVLYRGKLSDVIADAMREEVYNSDVIDETYADDCNDDWQVNDDGR